MARVKPFLVLFIINVIEAHFVQYHGTGDFDDRGSLLQKFSETDNPIVRENLEETIHVSRLKNLFK